MDGPLEVELKLEVAADDLGRLQGHRLVSALCQGPAVTKQLETVYFDTPERALSSAGFALRVRRDGAERVQTLKGGERLVAGGLFQRTELEAPLDGEVPDLALIADPALRAKLAALIGQQPLRPMFSTNFQRTQRILRMEESEWSLDADLGHVVAGDAREPIHEIELELRHGEPARLFEFALSLQEHFDLRPGGRSKADRGYALANGSEPRPQKASRVKLTADANTEDAWLQILSQCLHQIGANADCAHLGRDPEGLRQMRVGVRRLRTAFAVFAPLLPPESVRGFRSELRWLGAELRPARDLDIFQAAIAESLRGARGDPAFERLAKEAVLLRAECYANVREVLRSRRYARLTLEIGGWTAARGWRKSPLPGDLERLFAPAKPFAVALLDRRHQKIRRLGRQIVESDSARRDLRMQLKKLRNTGDFFRRLYPGRDARGFLRCASRLQDALGVMNDGATAKRILETLLLRLGEERGPAHDRAAGFIEDFSGHVAGREMDAVVAAWKDFSSVAPFWRNSG